MRRYRIIEQFRGGFIIQRKTWIGWRNCDFRYYSGMARGRIAYANEEAARSRLDCILRDEQFRARVVYEHPGAAA